MVVRIRLARFGKRHAPFYNIVVANARTARNSKPLEVIGTYNPIPQAPPDGEGRKFKDIQLDRSRAKYWLGCGAQPSDPAWRLLSMLGLIEPKLKLEQRRRYREELGEGAGDFAANRRDPPEADVEAPQEAIEGLKEKVDKPKEDAAAERSM